MRLDCGGATVNEGFVAVLKYVFLYTIAFSSSEEMMKIYN